MSTADVTRAVELAREHLGELEPRWTHVRAVGGLAECLCRDYGVSEELAVAAWLHDVGYSHEVAATGFHALDGARFLRGVVTSDIVTSLVAHHSGATFEAEERGLEAELRDFPSPPQELLDVLTFVDMTTSPTGERVSVDDRLSDILGRYEPSDPVFRAVTRSGPVLRESAARAAVRLGLADVGSLPVL
jgi:putative nucleotidyltransferase with HDIG domain